MSKILILPGDGIGTEIVAQVASKQEKREIKKRLTAYIRKC